MSTVEKVEKNVVSFQFSVSAEEFEKAIEKAYRKNVKKINLQGFRRGKAPRQIIERYYGKEIFYEDAINIALPDAYDKAVEENGISPVDQPEIDIKGEISKENGVKLKATCITKPEVEVKDYKGIEVEKVVNPVTDEDINKQLDALREKNVTVETVDDRAAENGDDVVIDFEGFKDDVAFEGGKAEDFTLSLGSGQFIPGFEDQIVGHNAGEDFDINVTFPEEYQVKELAGAPAVFKIKLKSISKKVMPELDDDMVKDSTEFDTVDEYKADVKKKLEEANEKHADSEVEAKIFDKVIENMTAEIPQVMFDNRVNEMIGELEQRLAPQGISLDLYMQYTGQTIDTVKKAYAEQAEKQVKLRLALEKIAKLENIEVTEDELKAEFDKLAEAYKLDVDQIKQFIHDDDLKKDIAVGKAVDLIKDAAVIK